METQELIASLALAQEAAVTYTDIDQAQDMLQINWDTRAVTIPKSVTNAGVKNDHLSKKLVFSMDRYVCGVDLANHTFAIHFINVDKWDSKKKNYDDCASGVYPVTNIDLSVDGKVTCEWEITNAATQVVGDVVFALHVFTIVDSAFTYHLGTTPTLLDLLDTVNATEHGKNITPDEIEVYIQKMADLSAEIDAKVAAAEAAATRAEEAAANFEVDDTLSVAGKAADAAATGAKLSQLSSDLADYGFPIPNVNWTDGYLKSDGTIQNGADYKVSNLIYIPSGFRLVFDSYASPSTYHFCNYLSDGTFESVGLGHTGLEGRHGIKIDAIEDRYVKICNNFVKIQDAKPHFEKLEIQPTKIADISNVLPLSGVTFVKGYLSSSTHNRIDSEVYYCSSLIFIQKGQTIEYKCSGSSGALLLMEVTRDSGYIASLFVGDSEYHRLAYTADHDMWVRICSRTEKGGNYVPLDEFKNSVKFYYKPLYHADEKLNGKIIVVIGDSLIHGNILGNDVVWCKILENKTGASVYNYGINGNAISSVSDAIDSPMSVRYSDIEELPTADIIIVEGGANDKNNSCPIGALSDANNNTFIGACNVLIDGIRALNPTARLLFMTTYPRYANADNNGKKEQDFADAMINACRNKSVPCFDNLEIGIDFTNANLKTWCDEGIYIGNTSNQHFSPKGYEFIYPKYKHWIESQI